MGSVLSYDIVDGRRAEVQSSPRGRPSPMARRVLTEGPQLLLRDKPSFDGIDLVSFGDEERPSESLMFVPIRYGETVVGMLSIQSYTCQAYTADLDTLQALADHCGGALDRIQMVELQRASEERFRVLFENSPDAIPLLDPHDPNVSWPIVECNDGACRMNEYTRADLVGQSIDVLNGVKADLQERAEYLTRLRRDGTIKLEANHRRKDGSIFPIEVVTSLISIAGRELILGIDRDISARKRAEANLRISQARLSSIISSAMDAIITIDTDQRITLFNSAAERMFRCAAAEAIGEPLDRFIPQQFRTSHHTHIRNFGAAGATSRAMGNLGKICGLRADGEEFPLEASISQIENDGEQIYTVILRDVTERRRAEQALAESAATLRSFYDSTPFLMGVLELAGDELMFISVNKAGADRFGSSQEDMRNQPIRRWLDQEQLAPWIEACRTSLANGGSSRF